MVKKSGYFPKYLNLFLYVAAFGHLLDAFANIVIPDKLYITDPIISVLTMGELVYMLWFVIMGVRLPKND